MAQKRGKRELINRQDGELFQSEYSSRLKSHMSVKSNLLQQKLDSYEKQRLKAVKTMEKDLHSLQKRQQNGLRVNIPSHLPDKKSKMNSDAAKEQKEVMATGMKTRKVNFKSSKKTNEGREGGLWKPNNSVSKSNRPTEETSTTENDSRSERFKNYAKDNSKLVFPSIYAQQESGGKHFRKKTDGNSYMKGIPRTERTRILPPINDSKSNGITTMVFEGSNPSPRMFMGTPLLHTKP